MSRIITAEELAKHNSEGNGVWIVIDGSVYDLSSLYFSVLLDYLVLTVLPVWTSTPEARKSLCESLEKMRVNRFIIQPSIN